MLRSVLSKFDNITDQGGMERNSELRVPKYLAVEITSSKIFGKSRKFFYLVK